MKKILVKRNEFDKLIKIFFKKIRFCGLLSKVYNRIVENF